MKTEANDPAKEYTVLEDNSGEIYTVRARNEREACKKASRIHFKTHRSSESEFGIINNTTTET